MTQQRSKTVCLLLAVVAISIVAGRIAVVTSAEGDTAFLSANDRSRWCTVSAIVEDGTYVIDRQIAITHPTKRNRRPWGTIDKVRHTASDGQMHYYSSKPPLFPTIVAGVYKVFHATTGMTLTAQPVYATRILLALVNLPLLAMFILSTSGVVKRVCHTDLGRITAVACVCFGTMLLPFSTSLNNHLPAAASTAVVMWIYARMVLDAADDEASRPNRLSAWHFLIAGIAAAFAAANELPALSMMAFWVVLFVMQTRASLLPMLAGIALVSVAFFGTNWIAHKSWRPAYAHRGNGPVIATLKSSSIEPNVELQSEISEQLILAGLIDKSASIKISASDESERWIVADGGRWFALLRDSNAWSLTQWDDWYEYPGTYWKEGSRQGVDVGEPSRLKYFIHMMIGHHGIFSLTPIWLLLPLGFMTSLRSQNSGWKFFAAAVLLATIVCIAFYLKRPTIDRNYGGVSVCFRWMLWFAPLWLAMIASSLDRWSAMRRLGWLVALLAMSVFSMTTALSSPWQSPWIYQFWQFLGWIER